MIDTKYNFQELSKDLTSSKGDVVEVKSNWKASKTLFFIGAGCSISAGIPTVKGMTQKLLLDIANTNKEKIESSTENIISQAMNGDYSPLVSCFMSQHNPSNWNHDSSEINWWYVYQTIFNKIYESFDEQRERINEFIIQAKGQINWAHLCLAELVRLGYCSTVATTNFDQLVLESLARVGVVPVVSDSLDSYDRIKDKPLCPQVIHLHGSRHSHEVLNSDIHIDDHGNSDEFRSILKKLVQNHKTFVFVGYNGNENWFRQFVDLKMNSKIRLFIGLVTVMEKIVFQKTHRNFLILILNIQEYILIKMPINFFSTFVRIYQSVFLK